jgi:hypothetical protein
MTDSGGIAVTDLKQEIGIALGYASMCWEPKPTGVFRSELASAEVERVYALVEIQITAALQRIEQLEGALRTVAEMDVEFVMRDGRVKSVLNRLKNEASQAINPKEK